MQRLVGVAARVAEVDSNVLIIGKRGVGKERLAKFIHDTSPRSNGPLRRAATLTPAEMAKIDEALAITLALRS